DVSADVRFFSISCSRSERKPCIYRNSIPFFCISSEVVSRQYFRINSRVDASECCCDSIRNKCSKDMPLLIGMERVPIWRLEKTMTHVSFQMFISNNRFHSFVYLLKKAFT